MQELLQNPAVTMTLFNALIAWPLWRIYRRAGLTPWWSLVVFVPMVGVALALGILGHKRWPVLPERTAPLPPKARRSL